jgi:hypothetical protein
VVGHVSSLSGWSESAAAVSAIEQIFVESGQPEIFVAFDSDVVLRLAQHGQASVAVKAFELGGRGRHVTSV